MLIRQNCERDYLISFSLCHCFIVTGMIQRMTLDKSMCAGNNVVQEIFFFHLLYCALILQFLFNSPL
jgi:hypothetical protein